MRVSLESAANTPPAPPAAIDPVSAPPRSPSLRWIWIALGALFLLSAALFPMQTQRLPAWAAVALAAGLVEWALVARKAAAAACEVLPPPAPSPMPGMRAWIGTTLALLLAAAAWLRADRVRFAPLPTLCWLAAILVWFAAWWPRERRASVPASPSSTPSTELRPVTIAAALLIILAVAVFFRFHRLAEIPPQPGSDHAEDLLNVVDLERGERPIFFPRNTGQPPLPFYFEYALHRAGLPIHYLTLKQSTALIGMVAIPAMYLLGAELGGPVFGLCAAALCAWCKWPVLGARRGLTFAWAVFPAALALWAILRYMRRGDRASALWAGFWLGFGQYGYNAFKIMPALVPVALGLCLFDPRWKGRRWRLVGAGALMTATTLLIFLPLLRYSFQHPQEFWYRALTRAGTRERPLPGPAPVVFATNLLNMGAAFHWKGDNAWINAVSWEPFLDPVLGALLLAGVLVALLCAFRGAWRWTLLLASLFVLTLASTLSLAFPIENPAINRAAVALPSVLLLASLPAVWIWNEARRRGRAVRLTAAASLLVLAAFSIRENYLSYFVRFSHEQNVILDPVLDMVTVLKAFERQGVPRDNAYLLNRENWVDGRCIAFEIDDLGWQDAHDIAPGRTVPFIRDRPLLFFFHHDDANRRAQLRAAFPQGEERLMSQPFGDRDYFIYFVER